MVLCVQDGTDLNFAEHPGCAGLGLIGKNQGTRAKGNGLTTPAMIDSQNYRGCAA